MERDTIDGDESPLEKFAGTVGIAVIMVLIWLL